MLLLHLIVIILGFTAIFGKLISLSAYELVWYRMLIALGALSVMLLFAGKSFRLPLKDITRLCGIGIIIATHWICFFMQSKYPMFP